MARRSVSPSRPRRSEDRYRDSKSHHEDRYERRQFDDRAKRDEYGDRERNRRRREDDEYGTRRRDADDRRDYDRRDRDRDWGDKERERERQGSARAGPSRRSASPPRRGSKGHSRGASQREDSPEEDKTKPNFTPSGLLAAATKTVKHVDGTSTVLKYHEPPEARKPTVGWRLYVFKGKEQVDLLHIQKQSAYLIGRDRTVADLALEHPSCSKQHAVIQYRQVHEKNEFGDVKNVVKPFIIDLESTNGTHVNDETIPQSRYYELKPGDVIKFGESQREYVLLHDEAV